MHAHTNTKIHIHAYFDAQIKYTHTRDIDMAVVCSSGADNNNSLLSDRLHQMES